jgi:hypothetical protein
MSARSRIKAHFHGARNQPMPRTSRSDLWRGQAPAVRPSQPEPPIAVERPTGVAYLDLGRRP